MKIIKTLAAAVVAVIALPSCGKQEMPASQAEGQSVISARILQPSEEESTKTWLGTYESGKGYPVFWSLNDSVALNKQGEDTYCMYTLTGGQNTMSGIFEPKTSIISSGSVYAYYPYSNVISISGNTYSVTIPAKQTLYAGSFGKGSMPMCAKATEIASDSLFFKPLMSVLKIRVKGVGDGIGTIIKRVIVKSDTEILSGIGAVDMDTQTLTMTTGEKKVELSCNVTLTSAIDSFQIALPASTSKNYTIQIVSSTGTFIEYKASGKSFTVQKIKRMAEQEFKSASLVKYNEGAGDLGNAIMIGDFVWAPVNCGYHATNFRYGKTFQFGRKVGGGMVNGSIYDDSSQQTNASASYPDGGTNKHPSDALFYTSSGLYDWYTNTASLQFDGWPMDAPSGTSGIGNPCPSGWRVPTKDELSNLAGNYSEYVADGVGGKKGRWFSGQATFDATGPKIFLPAPGYRAAANGNVQTRERGLYWASETTLLEKRRGVMLDFEKSYVEVGSNVIGSTCSVRCIREN